MNNKQSIDELSLNDLILIPFKYWKTGMIIFLVIFIMGLSGFLVNKKMIVIPFKENAYKVRLVNQVSHGFLWSDGKKEYPALRNIEIIKILMNDKSLWAKVINMKDLSVNKINYNYDTLFLSYEGDARLSIKVIADNNSHNLVFVTDILSQPVDKHISEQNFNDAVKKVNSLIVETCIEHMSDSINRYKQIREFVTGELDKVRLSQLKTRDDIRDYMMLANLYGSFGNPEKKFERTEIDVNIGNSIYLPGVVGKKDMTLKRFLIFLLIVDFLVALLIVYIIDYFISNNLVKEIKRVLKKS